MSVSRMAWIVAVLTCLIAGVTGLLTGLTGYGITILAVGLAAAVNLLPEPGEKRREQSGDTETAA
jgi:hypothetical protein